MSKGFSLIEVLLASLLFTGVAIVGTTSFISSSRVQTRTQVARETVQQSRFAMETMVRDIRMAKSYKIGPASFQLELTTHDDKKVTYSLDGNKAIIVTRDNVTKQLTDPAQVRVDLSFFTTVDSSSPSTKVWPYIRINMVSSPTQANPNRPETQTSYSLRTTVSLRNFVKQY